MDDFTKDELERARVVINSLISKCEKAKKNLIKGQRTLLENRISALRIASSLLIKEMKK